MSTLAIIPARKGSKRLPGKNMKDFIGVPLIYHTIQQARATKSIDEIVVSSNDKDVIKFCDSNKIPTIIRPTAFATDDSPTIDTINHVLTQVSLEFKWIVLLQPTSPLRLPADIENCLSTEQNTVTVSVVGNECFYKRNGAVYTMRARDLMTGNVWFSWASIMPPERSIDIDTQEDFDKAEEIMRERNKL